MTPLWPLVVLIPPLVVTLFGGRTAWAWLSLAAGVFAAGILTQYAIAGVLNDDLHPWLTGLILSDTVETAYHDTYYVIASLTAIGATLVPTLVIGPLLLLRAHPRRHWIDFALLWGAVCFFLLSRYGISFVIGFGLSDMPNSYVDYADVFQSAHRFIQLANGAALLLVAIAALRPIISWWRSRR